MRCRDCGGPIAFEDPDPAPGLCAECYGKRLERVMQQADVFVQTNPTTAEVITFLKRALEAAGEPRAIAHTHVEDIFREIRDEPDEW